MKYLSLAIIVVGVLIYRWTARVYFKQPEYNRSMLFWNKYRAFIIVSLPPLLWLIGVVMAFLYSGVWGILALAVVIIGWVAFS
jgi:hypothetical protein